MYREAHEAHNDKADRSLGELFSELAKETSTLVRQEVALAKNEMTQKAAEVGKDVGFLAAGGLIAYAGFIAILLGLIFLLNLAGVPLWASALIVGVAVALVGAWLVSQGINRLKNADLAPRQTIETLKEDKEWAKDQTR
jgi:uncharacterized membrane protein